eukprot:3525409-Rhodomonas_salina.1
MRREGRRTEEVVSLRRQDLLSLREVLAVLERRVVLPLREVAAPHVLVLICDHDLVDHEVRVHPQPARECKRTLQSTPHCCSGGFERGAVQHKLNAHSGTLVFTDTCK